MRRFNSLIRFSTVLIAGTVGLTCCEKTANEIAAEELRAQGVLPTGYEEELYNATVRGDTTMLRLLIQAGAPVRVIEPDGETLLHLATKSGQPEIAKVLIEAGLSIEQTDHSGITPMQLAEFYQLPYMQRALAAATLEQREITAELYISKLTESCLNGDFNTADLILTAGLSPDSLDHNGSSALHNCAEAGHAEGIRYLLSHGANATKTDTRNKTPLEVAREAGQQESTAELAAYALKQAGITPDTYASTLLHAVHRGDTNCVTLLHEAGADLQAKDAIGNGLVHQAVLHAQSKMIEHLHHLGLNLDTDNLDGQSPLIYAIEMDRTGDIALLHRLGVDINRHLPDGRTPLQFAVTEGHFRAIVPLATLGADVNATDSHGNTLLHFCASYGQTYCMEALLEAGAKVNIRNKMKWAPLHYACAKKHSACEKMLIAHRAVDDIFTAIIANDIDMCQRYLRVPAAVHQTDTLGCTPLHWAARLNRISFIPMLLEHGAKATATDKQDRTPGDCARSAKHTDFMQKLAIAELARHGIKGKYTQALHRAIANKDTAQIRLLADAGADLTQPDNAGWPPLHAAVIHNNAAAIPYLIMRGANTEARTAAAYSALHLAASCGKADCLKALVSSGADANIRSRDGSTPLHLATRMAQHECLQHLLKAGANVHLRNERGDTPLLELARWSWGSPESATELLAAGADLRTLNIMGENALHAAAISGNKACLALFIAAGVDTKSTTRNGKTPRQLATTNGHTDCVRLLQAAESNSLTAAE